MSWFVISIEKKWHIKVFACPEGDLETEKDTKTGWWAMINRQWAIPSLPDCNIQQPQWKRDGCNRGYWTREGMCLILGFHIPREWIAICILWDCIFNSFFHDLETGWGWGGGSSSLVSFCFWRNGFVQPTISCNTDRNLKQKVNIQQTSAYHLILNLFPNISWVSWIVS